MNIDEFIKETIERAKGKMMTVSDSEDVRSDKRFYGTIKISFSAGIVNPRVEKKDNLQIFYE